MYDVSKRSQKYILAAKNDSTVHLANFIKGRISCFKAGLNDIIFPVNYFERFTKTKKFRKIPTRVKQ